MNPMYQKFEEDLGVPLTADLEALLWQSMEQSIFGEEGPQPQPIVLEPDNLGRRIKALRRELGLTPSKAARKAKVPNAKWLNWEGNAEIPTEEEFERIVHALYESGKTFGLYQPYRRAPIAHLRAFFGRAGEHRSLCRGVAEPLSEELILKLRISNLDPRALEGLERWCEQNGTSLEEEIQRLDALPKGERRQVIQEIWEDLVWDEDIANAEN